MKMKRILSLLLVLVMSLSMATVPTFAEDEPEGEALYNPLENTVVVKVSGLGGDCMVRFFYDGSLDFHGGTTATSLASGRKFDLINATGNEKPKTEMKKADVKAGKWTVSIALKAGGGFGPITVTLDPSVKDTLDTPTAKGLADNITRANVRSADAADTVPEHDETLYKDYDVTGALAKDEENVDVTIKVVGMKAHYAGGNEVNNKGNWVGVAIPKIDGYTTEVKDPAAILTANQVRYSYGWGTYSADAEAEAKYGRDGQQPGVDSTHDTIYFNAFNAALAEENGKNAWIKAEYGTDDEPITIVLNIKFEGDPLIQTNTVTKVVLGPDTDKGGIKVTGVYAKSNNDEAKLLENGTENDTSAVELTAPTTDGGAYTLSLTDKLENAAFAELKPDANEESGKTYFELNSDALTEYGTVSDIVKKDGAIKFNYTEHKYSVSVEVTDGENDIDTATVKLTKGTDEYTLKYTKKAGSENGAYVYPDEGKALPAGDYTLTVTKAGYKKHEDTNVKIAYQDGTGVTDPKAITLEVKLTNVEELGDLVCTYDKETQKIKFVPADQKEYEGYTYGENYTIYYKAADSRDADLVIEGMDDATENAKPYEEEGIGLVYAADENNLNEKIVAVAIDKDGKMSKPTTFIAPTFGAVKQIEGVDTGATAYYSVPVNHLVDGLYVAAYYTINDKVEFTFTQVTEHTEVAVKKDCQNLMFILCVGRSDLSSITSDNLPMFFDIWPAAQNELAAG